MTKNISQKKLHLILESVVVVFELKCSNTTSNTDTVLGPDYLGTTTAVATLLTGTQNRGTLTTQVYLNAGQVVSIRFQQASTGVQPVNTTNGTTNFTVVKLL